MNGAFILKMKQRIFIKLSCKFLISKGDSLTIVAPLNYKKQTQTVQHPMWEKGDFP